MYVNRRGLGFISIGLGVLALIIIMRGSFGRGGERRPGRVQQRPAASAPQAPQAASNASPDYLRGYADGLEAGQQQSAQPAAPQGIRQERFGGRGGRDGGNPLRGWLGLLALPLLFLGGLMFFRNQGGRWRWNRGHSDRDLDRPPPARPEAEQQPPYTGETRNF